MFLRKIYYALSPQMRFVARKLYYLPQDLFSKRHPYEPPKGDIYTGAGDFIEQGKTQLHFLKKYIQMQPADDVLDIGSGIGRTAVALTTYLNNQARYEGFDVVEKGVNWCNSKIKKDFPNFNFTYVPLHNDLYNTSTATADQFKFPYENEAFNKSYLFSVFTHMRVPEISNYLKEIHRVLRSGGKCLATFLVYQPQYEKSIVENYNGFNFPHDYNGYKLMDSKVQSANIAVSEALLNKMVADAGLEIEQIVNGWWKDGQYENAEHIMQDMVILVKR